MRFGTAYCSVQASFWYTIICYRYTKYISRDIYIQDPYKPPLLKHKT